MAKKTAAVAPADTPAVPKKTKQTFPNLPCALVYFWSFAQKAWENCKANLVRFTAEGGRFTETFVDDQIAYIKAVKAMPNNRSRRAVPREVRLALIAARQQVVQKGDQLARAIEYTFKDKALVGVQLSAAGLVTFKAATSSDWAAVSSFIVTANTYIAANLTKLVDAGAVNTGFSTAFASVGTAFDDIWNDLLIKRQNAKDGTKAVAAGIVNIQKELNPMLSDALNYFKYEPELRALFVQENLIAQVQNGHPAQVFFQQGAAFGIELRALGFHHMLAVARRSFLRVDTAERQVGKRAFQRIGQVRGRVGGGEVHGQAPARQLHGDGSGQRGMPTPPLPITMTSPCPSAAISLTRADKSGALIWSGSWMASAPCVASVSTSR